VIEVREITFSEAICEALREEMKRDETVFLMGEDIGRFGGVFGVTKGLVDEFGEERIRDTPISETALVGGAVGASITGTRPVVEIMFADFLAICMDEVHHKAGKWRYNHGGQFKLPLVIRTAMGHVFGAGPEHSECPEAFYLHSPGLKIAAPSTPYDVKGLLKTAIREDNPILFFEHKLLYSKKGPVPEEEYLIPFGKADIKRNGKDVSIVTYSFMTHEVLEASEILSKDGIEAEVIDLRTLSPMDRGMVVDSVKKTNRVIIVEEGNLTGGVGAEIAAWITEEAFDFLDAPVKRVASKDVPIPFNPVMEGFVIPNTGDIIQAIKEVVYMEK
jgi:pyruvate/2-oxoglutarate/acetoin dehydrogenase E1 component